MRTLTRTLSLSAVALALSAGGLTGCIDDPDAEEELDATRDVKLWQATMIGTHNSYSESDNGGPDHKMNIGKQLDWGVRVLEFDVLGSVRGSVGEVSHGGNPIARRHCSSISSCLDQVAKWSAANPGHTPVVIYVEMSTDAISENVFKVKPNYQAIYDVVAKAWRDKIPAGKRLTLADGKKPMSGLANKIALVMYRKRGAWPAIASKVAELRKGYSVKDQLFLAGKNPTKDGDLHPNGHIYFVKADNPETSWSNLKGKPVFIATNVCKHHDCREEDGDKTRMLMAYNETITNGVLTNEMEDVAGWLGPVAKMWTPNKIRAPQAPQVPNQACFFKTNEYQDRLFSRCFGLEQNLGVLVKGENDEISSISISGNVKVVVYKNGNFNGGAPGALTGPASDYRVIEASARNLADAPYKFNDHISSFAVVAK